MEPAETIPYWTAEKVKATLPSRNEDSHKGTFGTALLLAGTRDMPGAALIASLGAMRSGLGKLVIGTPSEVIGMIVPVVPEATYLPDGLDKSTRGEIDFNNYKGIAVGPGLPPDAKTELAIQALLQSNCPLIFDAGALSMREYPDRQSPVILTPHPKEFSRITGVPIQELLKHRGHYTKLFAEKWGVAIVLKGARTLIAFPNGDCWLNPSGNSALAKGGTGDVLTGIMLGMLCCHDNWRHAVLNAVFLHGACADEWINNRSAHTLLAHEIAGLLPEVWKRFEQQSERSLLR